MKPCGTDASHERESAGRKEAGHRRRSAGEGGEPGDVPVAPARVYSRKRKPYYVCHPLHATDFDAGLFKCYETGLSLICARAVAQLYSSRGKEVQIRKRIDDYAYSIVPLVQNTRRRT